MSSKRTAVAILFFWSALRAASTAASSSLLPLVAKPAERNHNINSHYDDERLLLHHHSLLHRFLAVGDFDSLNTVLSSVQLAIDESPVITETVAGSTLTIALNNITCSQLQLGDVVIDWEQGTGNNQLLSNKIRLLQVDLDCHMMYTYDYLFFSGSGGLNLMTGNNTIVTTTNISRTAGSSTQAIAVNMTSCRASIQIQDMVFDGEGLGVLGSALNTVEGLVRDTVADKMQTYLCSFLGQFQEPLQTGLTEFTKLLDANATAYEPLLIESNLKVPRTVDLVNFQNLQGSSGNSSMDPQIIETLMDQISGYLSASTDDGDLNLNRLLQDSILDDDGGVTVDLTTLFPASTKSASGSSSGVTLFDNSNELGNWTLRFTSARILGLDSFTEVDALKAIGKYTLESTMTMDAVTVQLDAELGITTPDKSLAESFTLDMTLSDISLSVAMLLGIDMSTLGQLPLGAFMDVSNILPCITTSIYRLKSTGLDIQTMTIEKPAISGFVSPGLQRIMSEGLDAIFGAFNPLLSQALPNLMESTVLGMLDSALTEFLGDDGSSSCSVTQSMGSETFIDFRDLLLSPAQAKEYGASGAAPYGDIAVIIKDYVNNQLLKVNSVTGQTGLAELFIEPMTTNQSGTPGRLSMNEVVNFAGNIDIGEETAYIALNVRDVQINSLDSIGDPLHLLDPVRNEPNLLNNIITLGVPPDPVELQAKVLIDLEKDNQHIYNDISFSVALNSASALFELLMKMSEKAVMTFPIRDLFVWDCWLATIPAPSLDAYGMRLQGSGPSLSLADLTMSIKSMNFTVECTNCSSAKLNEMAAMISSDELNVDVVHSATNVINLLLQKISGRYSFLQTSLDRLLVDAGKFCPHSPEYDPNASRTTYSTVELYQDNSNLESMVALLAIMLSVAIVIVVLSLCLRRCVVSRHKKWLETLPKGQLWAIYENQEREREDIAAVNNNSKSLLQSKEIPYLVRVLAPVVLIGNIALFLSGHLSKGGTVELHVDVGGQKVAFTDFYTFSIAQTGVELWGAGYRPLAFLMLVVSGIWPYTKQLLTVVLWVVPPRWVSTATRGRALCVMDFLAKWSMVDVFVMIVSLAAFRVQVQSPDLSFLPDELYQIDILVVPVWGLYVNMLAQLLSQVTSHFIIGYHRLVVFKAQKYVECERKASALARRNGTPEIEAGIDSRSSHADTTDKGISSPTYSTTSASESEESQDYDNYPLFRHAFSRPHRGDSDKLVAKSGVNVGLVVLSIVTAVLVIVGCSVPCVSFDYQGIVGIAVESGQDFMEAKEFISVFSLTKLLMDQARFLNTAKDLVGMLSISILLLLSVFFVPLALVTVLMVEWFRSHSVKVRRRLRSAVEILQAWQYIEVLVLSIIVGAWQIGDVSELLLDDYCGGDFGDTLRDVASFGLIRSEDAKCFRVQAAIESGSFILVAAGVLLIALSAFVSMAVSQRTRDETRTEMEKYMGPIPYELSDDIVPVEKIAPVPVLFTDQFRWLLTSMASDKSSNASSAS